MTSSPESRLKLDHEIQLSDAASAVHPAGSESKQGPNTTTASQAESLLAAEKRTLEMMANGASLSEVLNDLCAAIDAHAPPVSSMVCLMEGESLTPCAGPHVPAAFKAAITPWRIGPDRASCGAAAFTKQRVIVPNISNDPRWPDDARDLTLSHGFSAAWSEPLISQDGEVLGTFAMYYPEPRTPVSSDFELISAAGHIARIAIELERSHLALKNALVEIKISENKLRTIIDTMPDLAWSARSDGSADFFNQRWLDYAGLSAEQASDSGWTVALHPEDRGRLMDYWRHLLASGEAGEIEARLRRFDGEFRWFLFRASPLRDASGQVVKWYGTNTDLEERKRAEQILRSNEQNLRLIVDTIPGFVCTLSAAGEVEHLNRQLLEYFGKTPEELKNWALSDAVHPDDLPRVIDAWRRSVETGQPYAFELRQRRADGVYRWFQSRALPSRDAEDRITGWYMLLTDIDDRKRAEDALRENEQSLRLIVDTIPGFVWTMTATGEVERANQQLLHYLGKTLEELTEWALFLHPDDRARVLAYWRHTIESGRAYEVEHRLRRADGVYRWFQVRGRPQHDAEGRIVRWYNLVTDIDERKQAEEKLRRSETYLAEAQRLSLTGSFGCKVSTGEMIWSEETFRIFEYDRATEPAVERILQRVHPEDKAMVQEQIDRATSEGKDCDLEYRLLLPDESVKHVRVVARASRDEAKSMEFTGAVMDVTAQRQARANLEKAFDEIAKSETELRTIIDAIPQLIVAIGADGNFLSANQAFLEYTGLTKEGLGSEKFRAVFHPEDWERLRDERAAAISRGVPFKHERRVRHRDGQYRWLLVQYNPLRDERGEVIRWYATGTDIDDRKQAEERTRQENFALREQIDQAFMFEEIVGSSPALKTVLSSIVKVAPTDSTVLITGETGTGKELIARAIHKGSQRAGQAFIAVNCASIPSSLIASELFGHEKGAFTGALQRRQGRFELANSGTIFLDEIGELPAETQIALLRVLQERQFERVGGNRVIPTDVRIIAATNRDLSAAIAAGTFRTDLFYRLNVFPIHVPPLRNRREDIPMLVEYFVKRYAEKARKQISKIDKNTLKLCQSYPWPGNIRELQNIIERSVILCTGDTFWIDEAWLSSQDAPRLDSSGPLTQTLQNHEKELIEVALAESKGKVAGPNGAAAKLGIHRSTLELKIKQLNIKKHTFR
jgi:formate hydrogenlyase transcriptional activator